MKFLTSKKLSDNAPLRLVMIWMLLGLLLASMMNILQKTIDYGTTPEQWCAAILGDEEQFIDPLGFKEILLSLHTELFGLILLFILISSMAVRLNLSNKTKMVLLGTSVVSLFLYPALLLSTPLSAEAGVIAAAGSFALFHLVMIAMGLQTLIALIRKRL